MVSWKTTWYFGDVSGGNLTVLENKLKYYELVDHFRIHFVEASINKFCLVPVPHANQKTTLSINKHPLSFVNIHHVKQP
jgi:hypothetical protein